MDAGLFIYFPRDPGQNIYFKVFDGQDIYFKKLPAPLLSSRINCTSPNKKKDQFQPFPNSADCHTKHIAMSHGLWPTYFSYWGFWIRETFFMVKIKCIWAISQQFDEHMEWNLTALIDNGEVTYIREIFSSETLAKQNTFKEFYLRYQSINRLGSKPNSCLPYLRLWLWVRLNLLPHVPGPDKSSAKLNTTYEYPWR